MQPINTMIGNIKKWHLDRKITINGNSVTQVCKLLEESGELSAAVIRNDEHEIKDAIGDIVVVLSSICDLNNITLDECIEQAWNDIKDRKGYLNSVGNFIKDESC